MAGARDQGRAALVPVSDKGGCELKIWGEVGRFRSCFGVRAKRN